MCGVDNEHKGQGWYCARVVWRAEGEQKEKKGRKMITSRTEQNNGVVASSMSGQREKICLLVKTIKER